MTDQEIADKVQTRKGALMTAMEEAYDAGLRIKVETSTQKFTDGIERTCIDLNLSRPIY